VYAFVAAVKVLPNRYLATITDFDTKPLPNNGMGYTYRHTDSWEGFMNYAVEIGSGATCVPSFIKIGSEIQKLIGGIRRHTDSMVIA
jgi:hypothetical protein